MNTLTWGNFFIPSYDNLLIMFMDNDEEEINIVRCRSAKQANELCEFLNQAIDGEIDLKKAKVKR